MDEVTGAANTGSDVNPGGMLDPAAIGTGDPAAETGQAEKDHSGQSTADGKADTGEGKAAEGDSTPTDGGGEKAESTADKSVSEDREAEIKAAWEEFTANIDPHAGIDSALVNDFSTTAREIGISVEQAKKLVDWQLGISQKVAAEMREKGLSELRKDWGAETNARLNRTLEMASWIDRHFPDAEFSKTIARYGIANDVNFVRGMYLLASHMDEDSLAASHNSGLADMKPESPLDGIRNAYKKYAR